jgi:hypothetical protein
MLVAEADTGSLDDVVELVVWIPTEDEVSLAEIESGIKLICICNLRLTWFQRARQVTVWR